MCHAQRERHELNPCSRETKEKFYACVHIKIEYINISCTLCRWTSSAYGITVLIEQHVKFP